MTVLCTNSSVVYSDITAAVAAEGGTNYGVPTRFEQTGASTATVNFVDVDFVSSFIYTATAGQETTGDINVGAQCTGMIQNNVPNSMISNLRTGMIRTPGGDLDMENLVVDAGPTNDAIIPANTSAVTQNYTNCIIHNSNDAVRIGATQDTMIFTNCTAVNNTGFGFLRPRCVDTVSLDNTSNDYIQIGGSSSNYWADDGTGSNAITESPSTDIFVDYAGGDYRLLATSSPALAGAGAFIQSAGALSVNPNVINSSSISLNPSITFASELNINPQVINSNSSSLDPVIEFKSTVNVTSQLVNSNSSSLDPVVSFSSAVNVAPQAINSNSESLNPLVSFSSPLIVNPQTVNSNSNSINPSIKFISELFVTPNTINSDSKSNNPTIIIGDIDRITDWSVGFKQSNIGVSFKNVDITSSFKINEITVRFK